MIQPTQNLKTEFIIKCTISIHATIIVAVWFPVKNKTVVAITHNNTSGDAKTFGTKLISILGRLNMGRIRFDILLLFSSLKT